MSDAEGAPPTTIDWPEVATGAPGGSPARGEGRYRIGGELGRGGMAVVHRAVDRELEREVALKLVRPDRVGGDERARLVREARALAKLRHPNVVTVYDVDDDGGELAIAMELVDGGSLRAWLADGRGPGEILAVVRGAGRGLAAAHAAGLVHRDFKPDNVLVGADGVARVADFGLARGIDAEVRDGSAATDEPGATQHGRVVGTPAYMAPELVDGGGATPASDQYAFAITLVEALTGRRPFAGTTVDARRAERDAAPDLEAVRPGWVRAVAARALAVPPSARFPSMNALLAALARDPAARRRRWLVAGGVTAALAIAGVAGARWVAARPSAAETCAATARPMTGIWDGNRRAVLAATLAKVDLPYAAAMSRTVLATLDAYAAALVSAEERACVLELAARASASASASAAQRRTCLDRRRNQLGTLVDRLLGGDPGSVARAGQALDALDPVATCETLDAEPGLAPTDPEVARQVAAILAVTDRIRVDLGFRFSRRVVSTAEAAVADARALGHGPTLAEALLTLGNALAVLDERGFEEPMREALMVAQAAGADRLVGRTAALLGLETWRLLGKLPEAASLVELATATSARVGRPPELEFLAQLARVVLLRELGRLDDSEAAGRAAMVAADAGGLSAVRRSDVQNSLAATARARGDYATAAARYREARAAIAAAWGEAHPALGVYDGNLAAMAVADGALADAVAALRQAIASAEVRGAASSVASSRNSLAFVLDMAGDQLGALTESERAIAAAVDVFGPVHPRTARAHVARARILVGAERADEAEAAITAARAAAGDRAAAMEPLLATLSADVAWLRGQRDAARAGWRAVVATAAASETDAVGLASLGLARDARLRGDAVEALAAARRAVDALGKSDGPRAPLTVAATIEAGLAGGDADAAAQIRSGLAAVRGNPRFHELTAAAERALR